MIRVSALKLRQRAAFEKVLDAVLFLCRTLYNNALQERRDAWRQRKLQLDRGLPAVKTPSFYDQCKELTKIRANDPTYAAFGVDMLRLTVLKRVEKAMQDFFRRCKTGGKPGFPRFKGRDRFNTIVFGTAGWKIVGKKLRLNGIGTIRFSGALHREGELVGLRLVRKGGCWYAHVLVEVGDAPAVQPSKNGVGIDVGIRTFAKMSDGSEIKHPHFLKESLEELAVAQQTLATKQCGSKRRKKAKARLVRLYAKIANRRKNFIWQSAAALAKKYDGFSVEKLDIQQMVSKDNKKEDLPEKSRRGLRRGIMDSAWGLFIKALACKAEEAGKPLVQVNPKGTSQRCSGCGSIVRKTLRDRVHDCPACGLILDRDENAARNIYDLGWRSAETAQAVAAECSRT